MRFLQSLLGLAVLAASGTGTVWFLWPDTVRELREENQQLAREKRELQQKIARLSGRQRLAEIHIIDQVRPGEFVNGEPVKKPMSTLEFIEIDREGNTLPAKRFVIHDDVIFFDALVIKFAHTKVAEADPLRGRSLALFRRVYGENQQPIEGFSVDPEKKIPDVYRVNPDPSELEKKLWSKFWDYATDPKLAEEEGVRIAQGEAVYVPVRKGDTWRLTLQNNGGLNLKLTSAGDRGPMKLRNKPLAESAD
jgi:hypothetical protein